MTRLERLTADHCAAVLDFERANRAYFAASVSDRGDEFFDRFAEDFERLLAEQTAGTGAFHVLVDDDNEVLGRVNLYGIANGRASLGYRVGQQYAGRGVATAAVLELCTVASGLGVTTLTAATSYENLASQRVLIKAGFAYDGEADPSELGGKRGRRFRKDLASTGRSSSTSPGY